MTATDHHARPNASESKKTIIHASLIIAGPASSPPLKNHSIIIEHGEITSIQPTSSLPLTLKSTPSTTVPILMPGLWDCHTHLVGNKALDLTSITFTPPALAGARLVPSLAAILSSGFTSVRDLGSHALEVAPAVNDGSIPGPHIYSSGAVISQTAGHGDLFDTCYGHAHSRMGVSDYTLNNYEPGRVPLVLADGIDEMRKAVRLQIRRGAHVIKVCASGGVLSIADDPVRQQYSIEELRVAVEEANRMGRVVAAHCHGKPGILAALEAGVKTIEHGTYLDEECVKMMKEKDAILVPTRTIVKVALDYGKDLMAPESYEKLKVVAKYHLEAYKLAVKLGVRVALGTDLALSLPSDNPMSLGNSGQELVFAVQEGVMSEAEAIEAATVMGPETLGELGFKPKSGKIAVGYAADVIALEMNPLEDIEVLKTAEGITHVWKSGKLCKGAGN